MFIYSAVGFCAEEWSAEGAGTRALALEGPLINQKSDLATGTVLSRCREHVSGFVSCEVRN